jgi:mannose-1-phosphate guanylyltransferase
MNKDNFAILMAGGVGSRFWPVSTQKHPKQFRDLLGTGETLIQTTFRRLTAFVPAGNIYVLTNKEYKDLVEEQLQEVKADQIVLEPVMRNTAPAVLLAALKIRKRNKNAVMIMAPSDHWIEDEAAFENDVQLAFETCRKEDKIVTLGIKPTFPNTGYGYIQFDRSGTSKVKSVRKFTEKPSFEKAREFLRKGDHLWNAGIFIWNADFIIRSFSKNQPELFQLFEKGEPILNTSEETDFINTNYKKAPDVSIDYAILEKEDKIYVIPATFDWNDLGTWGSLYNEVDKDHEENAILNARVLAKEASGNIISSHKNKVVVVEDLNDFIIVDEKEVLLLVPKEKEQDIKQIRNKVQEKFGDSLG